MWGCSLSLFLLPALLLAQTTGELRGTVTDPAGASVPAAKVTLTSKETGEVRVSHTGDQGSYAFPLLKIGAYTIAIEAPGFRKAIANATVRSAEAIAVTVRLELGQLSEQIEVNGAVSPMDVNSVQAQESFSAKLVREMPVARDPNAFPLSLAGIVPAPPGFNSGSFVTNGNRARSNNITIDNISSTDVATGGTGSSNNSSLNFSSIKEVKVITNNMSAEFGRNSGAQVQYITHSGTNRFHGELFEYFRNNVLNARDWFDRSGSPSLTRYNEFGGVLGGPVVRNKTHFFLSSELVPVRGLGGTRIAQVPTPEMRARVTDPTSKRLLEQYQLPVSDAGAVTQSAANTLDYYQYSARLDHQISSRDSIYGRFGGASQDSTGPSIIFFNSNLANFGLTSLNKVYNANINETHVFSATLVNELRGGFARTSPVFDLLTTVPIGPRINFSNGQVANFGHADNAPQGRVQNNYQLSDTVTWVHRAHNVKLGGDFFRYQFNSYQDTQVRGTYTFLNWDDFAQGRPNAYSQRFGGTSRGHRTWTGSVFFQDDYRLTPYLTLNLGLRLETFGAVREVNNLVSNLDFNCRDSIGIAGAGPLGCFTIGGDAIHGNRYLQPRLGFAWNPRGSSFVVRGGYGLVSDFNYLNPIVNQRALPPYVVTAALTGAANITGANSWANLAAGTAAIQQQNRSLVGSIRSDVRNFGDVNPALDRDLKNPQVHQWSLGIQREMPQDFVVKVSYVGVKANYLQRLRTINLNANVPAPAVTLADEAARAQEFVSSYAAMNGAADRFGARVDRRFNSVNLNDNSANSNFHAFEFMATRPFRGGLSSIVAYTYSKSIDDVSDGLTNIPNDNIQIQNPLDLRGNRGVSGFDVKHHAVVTHVWEPRFLRGFGMSGISSWRGGFPVSFEAGPRLGVQNISAIATTGFIRPNAAGSFVFNPQPAGSAGTPQGLTADPVATRRISAYAASLGLSQPLLGNFGTLGRNTHRLNGLTNFDWNAYKTIRLAERLSLKLRCEIYNVFNQHSFSNVDRNISSTTFGQYITLAQFQRTLQLGAVMQW
ncbi:MAG TPA: TonB-dependent receptor [Bryobacteraceae bacterium]|nr:TonB-dependent receptor [Bryobacteraceae bacterium]